MPTFIFQLFSHVGDINKFDTLPDYELSTDQLPYDYFSIMHPNPFTESSIKILRPIQREQEESLFTDLDFLHVKLVYGKGTVCNFYTWLYLMVKRCLQSTVLMCQSPVL